MDVCFEISSVIFPRKVGSILPVGLDEEVPWPFELDQEELVVLNHLVSKIVQEGLLHLVLHLNHQFCFKINAFLFNQLVSSKRAEGKLVPNMDFFINNFSSSINGSRHAFCDGCHPRRQFVLKVPINSCQPHFQLSMWKKCHIFLAGSYFQSLQTILLDLHWHQNQKGQFYLLNSVSSNSQLPYTLSLMKTRSYDLWLQHRKWSLKCWKMKMQWSAETRE